MEVAPNLYAYSECWVNWARQERLDHFIVFGKAHLRHILDHCVTYDDEECSHQGVGNTRLRRFGEKEPPNEIREGAIQCRGRLGGLLQHYFREAARRESR